MQKSGGLPVEGDERKWEESTGWTEEYVEKEGSFCRSAQQYDQHQLDDIVNSVEKFLWSKSVCESKRVKLSKL